MIREIGVLCAVVAMAPPPAWGATLQEEIAHPLETRPQIKAVDADFDTHIALNQLIPATGRLEPEFIEQTASAGPTTALAIQVVLDSRPTGLTHMREAIGDGRGTARDRAAFREVGRFRTRY